MTGPPMFALRPISEADHPFLWDLHIATMRAYVEPIWGWDEETQRRLVYERSRPTERLIIEVEAVAVGHLERVLEPDAIIIGNIQVHPDFQGRGLGTRVIQAEVRRARDAGLAIRLGVLVTNPKAEALYLRLGFVVSEVTNTHHFMQLESP